MSLNCQIMLKMRNFKVIVIGLLLMYLCVYCLPDGRHQIPVLGASAKDWNPAAFWYYPWGRSGVHKGIDIFAKSGTSVVATTRGIVVYVGNIEMGGNVVLVLGAKWRFHYYAHLSTITAHKGQWLSVGETLGAVGTSGNAQGKPPHLHFAIYSLFPTLNQFDPNARQAWRKLFYINPNDFLLTTDNS